MNKHRPLRRVVAPWFTPTHVERLRHNVDELVDSLLAAFQSADSDDFMDGVANRIPGVVFCWMMGAPVAWSDDLFRLSEAVLKVFAGDPAHHDTIAEAAVELGTLVHDLLTEKQQQPGDDLTSMLLAAVDGDTFTIDDVEALAFELLAASTDNPAHSIGAAVHLLATHPDQFAALRADTRLSVSAVEECGRYEPRVRTDHVYATDSTSLLGVDVTAGSLLTLSLLSAHFDDDAFPQPHTFDISRAPTRPHLGFGTGRHHCLGAALARMEIDSVLNAIAIHWHALSPSGSPRIERGNVTSVRHLPLTATPAGPITAAATTERSIS